MHRGIVLLMVVASANAPCEAGYLVNGQEETREVGQEDPLDLFEFHANAGERIIVSVGEKRRGTGDVVLEVGRGNSVIRWNSGAIGADVDFTAGETGTYFARVRENGNDEDFDYQIRMVTLPGSGFAVSPNDRRLGYRGSYSKPLDAGDLHLAHFLAQEGGFAEFNLIKEGNPDAVLDLVVSTPWGANVDRFGRNVATYSQSSLSDGGDFTVAIRESDASDDTSYRFELLTLPAPPEVVTTNDGMIVDGQDLSGSLLRGQYSLHPFYASAGSRVDVLLQDNSGSSEESPEIRVFDFDGVKLREDWAGVTAETSFFPVTSGLHYALVNGFQGQALTDFTLSVSGASEIPAQSPGDFNYDGVVDTEDYNFWVSSFHSDLGNALFADGNGDGIVDAADYTVWRDAYAQSQADGLTIPEPCGIALALCSILMACPRISP